MTNKDKQEQQSDEEFKKTMKEVLKSEKPLEAFLKAKEKGKLSEDKEEKQ